MIKVIPIWWAHGATLYKCIDYSQGSYPSWIDLTSMQISAGYRWYHRGIINTITCLWLIVKGGFVSGIKVDVIMWRIRLFGRIWWKVVERIGGFIVGLAISLKRRIQLELCFILMDLRLCSCNLGWVFEGLISIQIVLSNILCRQSKSII